MGSIFKNSVFNFVSLFTNLFLGLIVSVILARYLGPQLLGNYSYFMWLLSSFALVATLGVPKVLTRYIASFLSENRIEDVKQLVSRLFIFELKVSLLVAFVFILVSLFVLKVEKTIPYLIIGISLPLIALNYVINGFFQGLQKYSLILKINFFLAPINLILLVLIIFLGKEVEGLLIINFVLLFVTFLPSLYLLKDYLKLNSNPVEKSIHQEITKYAFSASLIVLLDLILMEKSEVFFLKLFSDIEQVGFYSLSFGLVSKVMVLIPGAISGVLMPKVAWSLGNEGTKSVKDIYKISSRYLMMITFPIVFGGIVIVDLLINILFGTAYKPAIPVIQILLVSGGLSAIVAAAAAVIYAIGKQSMILKIGLIAATANILLDIFLIPKYAALGAALANGLSQTFGVIAGTYYMVRISKMPFPWTSGFKSFISAVMAALVVFLFKQFTDLSLLVSFILLSFLYGLSYLVFLILFKAFNDKDLELIERIVSKIPNAYLRKNISLISSNLILGHKDAK